MEKMMKMGCFRNSGSNGLSVLEVLIAVSILLVGFLSLMGVFPVSFQGIGKARNLSFAMQLAQQNMENYSNYIESYCVVGSGCSTPCSSSNPSCNPSWNGSLNMSGTVNDAPLGTSFTWQVLGTPVCPQPCPPNTSNPSVISVMSWVRWLEYQGTLVNAPGNAPGNITGGYGAHFLSYETWVYLP